MATPIKSSDGRWEGIQQAKSRSGLRVGTIIAAVRQNTLQLGQRTDRTGYAGFCVLKAEIDQIKPKKPISPKNGMVTAAAFGRSVGNRTPGWFENLALAGHTPVTREPHPKWGDKWTYVSQNDMDAFFTKFMTSSTIRKEFGIHPITLAAKLRAAKVKPFSPNGEVYGPLYLRDEVEAVLNQIKM